MQKVFLILAVTLTMVFAAAQVQAVGPKVTAPHSVTSDDMTSSGCTYVKVYWRKADGVSAFTDANSVNAGKIWLSPYDMLLSLYVSGSYELAGSCNDAAGNESALSKSGTGRDGALPFSLIVLPSITGFGIK